MANTGRIRVWDIGVRLFHWTLVVAFTVAYLSGDEEGVVHAYAGYAVIALLAFRTVWGFVGTRHARFVDFIYGPKATLVYVRSLLAGKPIHTLGHNPLGGWMAIALIASLAAASWSGLEAYAAEGKGPLARIETHVVRAAHANGDETEHDGEDEGDEFWEEIHEALSNLSLALVFLHVAGVGVASLAHRENLVKAMITGDKIARGPDAR